MGGRPWRDPLRDVLPMLAEFGCASVQLWALAAHGELSRHRTLLFAGLHLAGLLVTAASQRARRGCPPSTYRESATLVTCGIHGRMRYPDLTARWLACAANAVAIGSAVSLLAALVILVALSYTAMRRDRRLASSSLAQQYEVYRRRTGRLLPRLRRPRPVNPGHEPADVDPALPPSRHS